MSETHPPPSRWQRNLSTALIVVGSVGAALLTAGCPVPADFVASPSPTPSGTPTVTPGSVTPGSVTPTAKPTQDALPADKAAWASTLRLKAEVTSALPLMNQVSITCGYMQGPDALYARIRQANASLPERTGLTYADLDTRWRGAGGSIETAFQPGTVGEGDEPVGQSIGSQVEPGSVLVNVTDTVTLTLPWPSQAYFDRFKSTDGTQKPVTGYVLRKYSYQGQTLVSMVSNHVTWGNEPKEVIAARGSGGGGGGSGPANVNGQVNATNGTLTPANPAGATIN